jgi:hypothetical protein
MYSAPIDRGNPSLIVVLVDHSFSMSGPLSGAPTTSKAAAVSSILNGLLYELVLKCVRDADSDPLDYFAVSILGYSTDDQAQPIISPILSGPLAGKNFVSTSQLAKSPLRIETMQRTNAATGQVESYKAPVWVEPAYSGGTPMTAILNHACGLVDTWIRTHPNCFPPIVINLTDGESTDGDPSDAAIALTARKTVDGPVLLFNLGISSVDASPMLFPSDTSALDSEDHYGRGLFAMSSPLPDVMLRACQRQGLPARAGARGFGYNADGRSIVTFLSIGTSVLR